MRILQIGATYVGAQRIIEGSIHRYLKEHGCESRILYAIGQADDSDVLRYETRFANLVRRGLTKIFGKNYRFAFLSTIRLIREIEKYAPELVHLHTVHHGYIDFDMLMSYLAKKEIPVVYTMHDMWAFTGGCYYYTDIDCCGYKNGCRCCPKKMGIDCSQRKTGRYFDKKKELFQKQKSICFVAVSQWVHNEAVHSAVNRYPQYTIWNGVDISAIAEKESQLKDTDKFRIIGVAGTWTERKGIDRFLELADRLGDGFEIVLVGDVASAIRKKAPTNIVFTGKVTDRAALDALYASADIHISMSLEETFGMTFVEAAFNGVKSIGFDSTAIAQVIKMVNGYVVQPGSVTAIAELLEKIKYSDVGGKLTAEECQAVCRRFSVRTMAQRYLEVYQEQLGES